MDRREFLKDIVASSALASVVMGLGGGQSAGNRADAFYLLSDRPQDHLPGVLEGLARRGMFRGRTISLGVHPRAAEIRAALRTWRIVPEGEPADVMLRFEALRAESRSSFTLVSGGRLVDERKGAWLELWRDMQGERASGVTVASFAAGRGKNAGGTTARVSMDGRFLDRLSLDVDGGRTYSGPAGRIGIRFGEGSLWIEHAECRHRICALTPPASRAGDRILCAPNRFLAEVEGRRTWDTVIG